METESKIINLDDNLRKAAMDFIDSTNYVVWTKIKYKENMDKLFKKYRYLDKKICKKIISEKNPNKRVVLSIIYKAAEDFDINIPIINVNIKRDYNRKLPERIYTLDQINGIIGCLPDKKIKLFFSCTFSIGAGLRVSETITMKWKNFNWAEWIKDKDNEGSFTIIETKRNHSYSVPVPHEIMNSLYNKALIDKVKTEMIFMGEGIGFKKIPSTSSDAFVFDFNLKDFDKTGYYKTGDSKMWLHLYIRGVYNHLQYYYNKKYIYNYLGHSFKLHSLRHARATQLLNNGKNISNISKLLGHKSINTTMIYLDMTSKDQTDTIRDIPIPSF